MNRIGKFYVSHDLVNEANFSEVLSKLAFIPYRVEHLFERDAFEYIGVSPMFDELEQGLKTPEYEIIVAKDSGEIYVEVRRQAYLSFQGYKYKGNRYAMQEG